MTDNQIRIYFRFLKEQNIDKWQFYRNYRHYWTVLNDTIIDQLRRSTLLYPLSAYSDQTKWHNFLLSKSTSTFDDFVVFLKAHRLYKLYSSCYYIDKIKSLNGQFIFPTETEKEFIKV